MSRKRTRKPCYRLS